MSDQQLHQLMGMNLDRFFYHQSNAADEDIIACNIRGLDISANFSKGTAALIINVRQLFGLTNSYFSALAREGIGDW